MSMIGYKSENHPQQTALRGALDEVDDRGTKWEFIRELEARFGAPFTLDVAAAEHNAKAPTYYTRADNGLERPWTGRVWCNPPYSRTPESDLGSWVRKAWSEWNLRCNPPERIVMLVPANRVEQAWWQEHVEPFRDRAGSPLRCEFQPAHWIKPEKGDRPPFGLALLIWDAPAITLPLAATCPSHCGRNQPCPDPWHDRRVVYSPANAPYESCVLDADGRCTRWSHDHSSGVTSPPGQGGA